MHGKSILVVYSCVAFVMHKWYDARKLSTWAPSCCLVCLDRIQILAKGAAHVVVLRLDAWFYPWAAGRRPRADSPCVEIELVGNHTLVDDMLWSPSDRQSASIPE